MTRIATIFHSKQQHEYEPLSSMGARVLFGLAGLGALAVGALALKAIGRLGVLGKLGSYCFMGAGGATFGASVVLRTLEQRQKRVVEVGIVEPAAVTEVSTAGNTAGEIEWTPVNVQHSKWSGRYLFKIVTNCNRKYLYFDPKEAFFEPGKAFDASRDEVSDVELSALTERTVALLNASPWHTSITIALGPKHPFSEQFVKSLTEGLKRRLNNQVEIDTFVHEWESIVDHNATEKIPRTGFPKVKA